MNSANTSSSAATHPSRPRLKTFWKERQRIWLSQPAQVRLPTRQQVLVWIGVMFLGLGLMIYNYPKFQVGIHYDDAAYITLARSITQADTYGLVNFPEGPQPWNYPFGYPLLLAPFSGLFGGSLSLYKLISIFATLANASLIFWGWGILTRKLSFWWGLGVAAIYLYVPATIDLSGRVMSEPVFLTACLIAMLLVEQAAANPKQARWWVGLAVVLMFVVFIRTIGIIMAASYVLYLLLRCAKAVWKPLALTLAGSVLLTGLVVATTPIKVQDLWPSTYLSDTEADLIVGVMSMFGTDDPGDTIPIQSGTAPASSSVRGLRSLLYDYLYLGAQQKLGTNLREALLPAGGSRQLNRLGEELDYPALPSLTGYLLSAMVLAGYFLWQKKERLTVFSLSAVLYYLALFAWVENEARFLIPIYAQLVTALLFSIQAVLSLIFKLLERLRPGTGQAWTARLLAAFIVLYAGAAFYASSQLSPSRLHVGDLSRRTRWIRENTAPEAVIMSEYPVLDYLYGDRQTTYIPLEPGDVQQEIDAQQADYLLLAPELAWIQPAYIPDFSERLRLVLPALQELIQNNRLTLVYQDPDNLVRVYRIQPK